MLWVLVAEPSSWKLLFRVTVLRLGCFWAEFSRFGSGDFLVF